MKIRILDRILVALAGLLMLLSGAALAAQLFFGKDVAAKVAGWLNDDNLRVYIIIGGIVLLALGVYCVLLLFRHKGKSGKFIMQRTESGELAISLKALESMVMKCLDQHKELSTQSVRLDNHKGSLLVSIRGTVAGGISIPLTVDTLQQQIKQYVTACSGVEVRDIRVEIESSGPDAKDAPFLIAAPVAKGLMKGTGEETEAAEENAATGETEQPNAAQTETPAAGKRQEDELSAAAAAAAMLMNKVPEEADDRPMHQRIFSSVEEPCVMPMPPVNREEENRTEGSPEAAGQPGPEPKAEEKKTEEPATEGLTVDETKTEGLKTEEPKTEEPKTEEKKAEEGASEKTEPAGDVPPEKASESETTI